mmetsp:Transcript_116289/g.282219  ORF Transcript_116289/g.282219 Transcript_116289/m.282219 type:complete len:394 (+) Transcript_116289:224-1405(+)
MAAPEAASAADGGPFAGVAGGAGAEATIAVRDLTFEYGAVGLSTATRGPVLRGINFNLPAGSRCLLVGDNGCGKSTLLRLIGGKHIHEAEAVQVLGKPSFHTTALNNRRVLMASDWGRRTVAFQGFGMAHQADIAVGDMLKDLQTEHRGRRDELVRLLGVDLTWRMHQVSDGQRRRVQIMLQLLRPCEVYLLDEITADLDVITRSDFLAYMKRECEERGITIVYATHIFDGLSNWATHIAYMDGGRITRGGELQSVKDFTDRVEGGVSSPLLATIESWMREDRARRGLSLHEIESEDWRAAEATGGEGWISGRLAARLKVDASGHPMHAKDRSMHLEHDAEIDAAGGAEAKEGETAAKKPKVALRSTMGLQELMAGSMKLPAATRDSRYGPRR